MLFHFRALHGARDPHARVHTVKYRTMVWWKAAALMLAETVSLGVSPIRPQLVSSLTRPHSPHTDPLHPISLRERRHRRRDFTRSCEIGSLSGIALPH